MVERLCLQCKQVFCTRVIIFCFFVRQFWNKFFSELGVVLITLLRRFQGENRQEYREMRKVGYHCLLTLALHTENEPFAEQTQRSRQTRLSLRILLLRILTAQIPNSEARCLHLLAADQLQKKNGSRTCDP